MDSGSLAQDAIKYTRRNGCDAAEVFVKTGRNLSIEVKEGRVEALELAKDFGVAVRVIKNHRLGFSFTTKPEELRRTVEKAIESISWTMPDEYNDIPEYNVSEQYAVSVLDKEIEGIDEDEAIKKATLLEESALNFDKRIRKVRKAVVLFATGDTTIYNSRGINISYRSSAVTAHIMVLASDREDSQIGWDFAISRKLSNIDFTLVGSNASKKAIKLLGAKKISPVKVPVVLDPSTASSFLSILRASFSAESVQKNKSFLAGKVNKAIISPLINVIDDGLMPWGIGTRPVDDEGIPVSRKTLISKGILTGFIHNSYTAKKDRVASTGNAARSGFKNLPGIDVLNLYIEPNEKDRIQGLKGPSGQGLQVSVDSDSVSKEKLTLKTDTDTNLNPRTLEALNPLIRSLSKGILVIDVMGVHTANPISGDFSIGISGLWIENGETAYPVKEAIISGNILELFKRVEGVGDDLRFYGKVGSPSLLIEEMDVSA